MSTIQPQHKTEPPKTQPHATYPHPSESTDERLNRLLASGPNWSKPPKAPNPAPHQVTPQENPDDLDPLLTRENIKQIVRSPNAPESKALIEQIGARLTRGKIHAMLQGPNGEANARKLKALGKHLHKDEVDCCLAETRQQRTDEKINQLKLRNIEMLTKAFEEDSVEGIAEHIKQWRDEKTAMAQQFSESSSAAKGLNTIGSALSEDNVNNMRRAPGKTYSYGRTSESTLDAPSEIRNFAAGDTLNLSGIQKQLNKPLQVVNTFTGASGEVKIDHSASSNTSVVSVSANPGEPPFVVKVFGEVRQSNLLT